MDMSSRFMSCVKFIALNEKDLNIDSNFTINRKRSSFSFRANKIRNEVFKLCNLQGNRQKYSNFHNYIPNSIFTTKDICDQFNNEAKNILNKNLRLIEELKEEIAISAISQQNYEHRKIILFSLEENLRNAYKIYLEHKSMYMKKSIEQRKISKLKSEIEIYKINFHNNFKLSKNNDQSTHINNKINSLKIQEINGDVSETQHFEIEQFSSEDIQMFEFENEQLYNELNTITEEIKQIENKVVQISELQEIFTEKILDQDKKLENVITTVVGSTENVKEANEHIRKAIQRNAGLRVWILFFILVMSFTLIFLDWYNP